MNSKLRKAIGDAIPITNLLLDKADKGQLITSKEFEEAMNLNYSVYLLALEYEEEVLYKQQSRFLSSCIEHLEDIGYKYTFDQDKNRYIVTGRRR